MEHSKEYRCHLFEVDTQRFRHDRQTDGVDDREVFPMCYPAQAGDTKTLVKTLPLVQRELIPEDLNVQLFY